MRKMFALLLAAAMVFSLTSCGSASDDYSPAQVNDTDYDADQADVADVSNEAENVDESEKSDKTEVEIVTELKTETVYALDPDAYFGLDGELTESGLEYYTDGDAHDYAEVYVTEILCDEYSFSLVSTEFNSDYLEWQIGYGDSTSDPIIWVYAYDDQIVVAWDDDIVQWVTPKNYESTVVFSYEEDTTEEEILKENTEDASDNLPPTIDEVYSFLTLNSDDGYDDSGNAYLTYNGCKTTDDTIATIEGYIEALKDYGYSLLYSEKRASSYYVYYLECSDSDVEEFTYRDQDCQLALEGFTNDSYGWHTIYVYYSPSIVISYRSVNNVSSGSSSGTVSSSGGSSSSGSGVTVKCTKCHGSGEITCTNCNGTGYKETYVSVPNYSGHSSTSSSSKQICSKCKGSGTITCTRCGGSGTE